MWRIDAIRVSRSYGSSQEICREKKGTSRIMRSSTLKSLLILLLALGFASLGIAQTDTARLQGTITDQNDAVVSGATVTVTSLGTGRAVTATTNELGYYTVPGLQPGSYSVDVTQKGFKRTVRELDLQVAQIGVADFRLEVGAVSESVIVEGGSPVINLGDSAIGDVVESVQVTQLPLNGRNFTQLATLVPGVTRGVPTASATGSGGNAETFRDGETGGAALSVNGLRPQNNNFTLDGIDNNEALVNTIVFFPSADAIDEFRVQTSVAPAQYGRAGGALVLTSLKSGTNDFHGSAFWFNRNTDLNARDFFFTGPTPGYNRNQFGGTFGGPIIKNKLFFFVDYQGLRKKVPNGNGPVTVPTDAMRNGDFSQLLNIPCGSGNTTGLAAGAGECTGGTTTFSIPVLDPTTGLQFMGNGAQPNVIPANRINSVGQAYLNAYPEPNCDASIDVRCHSIEQNFTLTRKIIENWNDFDARADWNINTANTIFGRLSRGEADQTNTTSLGTLPSGFGSGVNFNHPWGAAIGWNDIINTVVLNEVRVGFVRTDFGYTPPGNSVPYCTQLGIANCYSPQTGGIALIGGYASQIEYTGDYGNYIVPQNGYQASDTVTWTHGRHTLKSGGSMLKRQLNMYRPLSGKGYFFLNGNGNNGGPPITNYEVSDILAGFVESYSRGTSEGIVGTRSWEGGFFVQDDFRVLPRLTLNLGLRYDILTWPHEVDDRQANFDIATLSLVLPNQDGYNRQLINNNWKNFAPRVGFAYQLTGDGKTALRGGFGIFYFLDRGGISNQLVQNPPFSGQNTFNYSNGFRFTLSGALPCSPNCTQAQLIATDATAPLPSGDFQSLDLSDPTNVSVISYMQHSPTSRVAQWNLQVQRQLDSSSSLSLAYVGDRGIHLTRNYNANQQLFGISASAPDHDLDPTLGGSITTQENSGNSHYNSLQAQYERRFHHGFQFLGAFTWSKTIDDSCGDLDSCMPQLYSNYAIERGLSNIDQNYRLVLSSLYQLPFGKGMRWGSNWARPIDLVLGGWQLNGIYTLQAGLPFSVTVDGNPNSTRADLVGKPGINPGNLTDYINAAAFAVPATTKYGDGSTTFNAPGTAGRDILRGPGLSNIDLSIFKNFHVTERMNLEFRFQAYNATNTPHFGNPNADFSQGNFGTITTTLPFSYRQCELGLRLTF
jgi:Carboxypeptidase regulatory-like domain